ncbi:UDP-N-acetylmuramoyl-L-alanine--D-glutamate ligase, partial [Acidovorax sp. CCYZU-2555]|nr:UDP-N-acetylmuramoyl-L-alanine--D-glutamate ligase [Acidovorax sp. CCYZU-2555]
MNTPASTPVTTDALAPVEPVAVPEEALPLVQEDHALAEPAELTEAAAADASAQPLPATEVLAPPAPVPPLSSLHAAEDAAAFVAQIFAQVAAPAPDADAQALAVAAPEAAPELPPVPAAWPQMPEASEAHELPLSGQQLLVLGLGASGLAMARWCARLGAQVTVADTRQAPPQLAVLAQELPQVRFVAGAFDASLLDGQNFAAVYRSPGLSPEQLAPVLAAATAQGLRQGGELDLFALALQS